MSFVFYDTETTGTNTSFDQILQFGAIRTDSEFRELDRFEIRCRLLPYVVPSPGALRVTGVRVAQLIDPSLPSHYEMVRQIRAKLASWSPAIFIGHNTLNFDEHLLRQALYKTLHAPYLTNTNGNCRTDSLRLIQATERFVPGVLKIPVDDRGKQSFKLDRLAPANGFDHSDAHDAMADVEATIHICKLIAECTPELWSGFVRFAQKAAVNDFAIEEEVFSLTEFYFGKTYSWMVTVIGQNPKRSSELLVLDVGLDPDELCGLNDAQLANRLSQSPKPVRVMKTNAGPIIMPYDDVPAHLTKGLPLFSELKTRAAKIRADKPMIERLIAAYTAQREDKEPSIHVEEQIYGAFAAPSDQTLMDRFHDVDWPQRLAIANSLKT